MFMPQRDDISHKCWCQPHASLPNHLPNILPWRRIFVFSWMWVCMQPSVHSENFKRILEFEYSWAVFAFSSSLWRGYLQNVLGFEKIAWA